MIVNNLPPQATPFVGRKQELAEITERLRDPTCRLLTLVGPGGMGKTRVALETCKTLIQRQTSDSLICRDGVYFISLQGLISSDFNLSILANSIGLKVSAQDDLEAQLLRHLRPKSVLLILDNFEHLLDGTALISRLLQATARLKILTTSREALNLQEEWLYPLDGMHYPSQSMHKQSDEYDAVTFFTRNAQRIHANFLLEQEYEEVKNICQLVEGMPLALELASSWVRTLSVSEIANEIAQGLDILEARATNVPERHRSMRAVLDSAWNRLTTQEQTVFKKLSVFRKGFTREAAEVVTNATRRILAGLVDKSWLRHPTNGRYDIHELLRQYGAEHLNANADEKLESHHSHCRYYTKFLAPKWKDLVGEKAKQTQEEIVTDLENIWACWDWASCHKRVVYLESILYTLWYFYDIGNRFQEGLQLFSKAAQLFESSQVTHEEHLLYGKLMMYKGALYFSLNQMDDAERLLKKSLNILQSLGVDQDHAFCLLHLGMVTKDIELEREYYQTSRNIYKAVGFPSGECDSLLWLGLTYYFNGDTQKGKNIYEEALEIARASSDQVEIGSIASQLSNCAYLEKSYIDAQRYAKEAFECFKKTGTVWGLVMTCGLLAASSLQLREYRNAEHYILQALTMANEYHLTSHILRTFLFVAELWAAEGNVERAVEIVSLGIQTSPVSHPNREFLLLDTLMPLLPQEKYAAAFERGKIRDFDKTVQEVLDEFEKRVGRGKSDIANPLTPRELEILRLVAKGLPNKNIAAELHLAIGTVKWYMKETLSKLSVENRIQAVNYARKIGLID